MRIERIGEVGEEWAFVVAFLERGGDYDTKDNWYTWDSEMRSYANAFASMIRADRHRVVVERGLP